MKKSKDLYIGIGAFVLIIMLTVCFTGRFSGESSPNPVEMNQSIEIGDFRVMVDSFTIDSKEYYSGAGFKLAKLTLQVTNTSSFERSFSSNPEYSVKIKNGDKNISSSSVSGGNHIQPDQTASVEFFFHIPNGVSRSDLTTRITLYDGRKIKEDKYIKLN